MLNMDMAELKILIIDDDEDDQIIIRDLILEGIKGIKLQVDFLYPALDGALHVRIKEYDVCLFDYQLGEITGIKLLQEINDIGIKVPVILLTGQGDEEVAVEAMKAGVVDYINKNKLTSKLLCSSIRYAVELHRRERLKELVEEENRKLSRAVEQSSSTVVITDTEGKIEYVNPKFTQLTGYSLAEALGQNPRVLKSGRQTDEYYRELWETIAAGHEWRGEFLNKKKNGEFYWEFASISPIRNNEGCITHYVAVKEDITDRKQAEEQVNEYAAKIETQRKELEQAYRKISDNMIKARQMHERFFPVDFPQVEGFSLAAYYKPAEYLGGDFYNVVHLDNRLLVYITDVTGHGLDGAMLTVFIRETINSFLLSHSNRHTEFTPGEILEFLKNQYCLESFPEDYFICIFLGIINLNTGEFMFANAGMHQPPLILPDQGSITQLTCKGPPISEVLTPFFSQFKEDSIIIHPGDMIFLTTDGLIEETRDNNMYGKERLKKVLTGCRHMPPRVVVEAVKNDFDAFAGSSAISDDVTFLVLYYQDEEFGEIELTTDSEPDLIGAIKEDLVGFLAPYSNQLNSILIGAGEMLANAMEHGNKFDIHKHLVVKAMVTKGYIIVEIKDEGEGFDWQNKLNSSVVLNNLDEERGRGIGITKLCFDKIYYDNLGTTVILVKKRFT